MGRRGHSPPETESSKTSEHSPPAPSDTASEPVEISQPSIEALVDTSKAPPSPEETTPPLQESPPEPPESTETPDEQADLQESFAAVATKRSVPPDGMVWCRARQNTLVRGVVMFPGSDFTLSKAEAHRAASRGWVDLLDVTLEQLESSLEKPAEAPMVRCRAIKTCLVRGVAKFPPEEFLWDEDEAMRAFDKGSVEIL